MQKWQQRETNEETESEQFAQGYELIANTPAGSEWETKC